ncbi:MAG: histone deacetylase [Bacteroidia bacterium]|nr:histone deacetylase [Bacteroidia bacterium]
MLKIAWSETFFHPLPEGHRFPMEKYQLIPEQLMYEGTVTQSHLFPPKEAEVEDIVETHCPEYWRRLENAELTPKEIRKIGFPYSHALIKREKKIIQGSVDCALYALEFGVSMNVAGGTHHAYTNRGEGFCLLNDFGVAASYLLSRNLAQKIMIVDLDVHQGNGTAEIFRDNPNVFTFSMHCGANYPLVKEKSDMDIELQLGITDIPYLNILKNTLPEILDAFEPDFVFYLSGVDILHTDKLGKLACTIEGAKQRDRYVLELCHKNKIPVAVAMGGGYSAHIKDIVEAHCNTFRLAQDIWF